MTPKHETTARLSSLAAACALLLSAAAAGQSEEDFEVGGIPDAYVRPAYPPGVESNGSCGAFFEVKPDGAVDMPSLSVSCTNPAFVAAVEEAMAQWRFEPTIVEGRAVAQTGFSARIMFTGGSCVRVISGNMVDTPCAAAAE
jgi:outer membrane biosynthesis protein TonB